MEQHHTTERDFQVKQLQWTNSGVERQKQQKANDGCISSFNNFQRWLQKIDGFKKWATTKNITPQIIKNITPQQAINNVQQLSHLYEIKNTSTTIQHDFFNYFSSGIDGGVENRPVVDNVLRPNPEACHIRYLPPYTYWPRLDCTCVMLAFAATVNGFMSVTIG